MIPPAPVYYCPPGVPRPEHIRAIAPVNTVDYGGGPDGLGGMTYGGAASTELTWEKAGAWYFAQRCAPVDLPRATMRTNAIDGSVIAGWLVPAILGAEGVSIVGYFGPDGFVIPERYRGIVEELRALVDYRGVITDQMADLATRIIALNHHVSAHEIGATQTLTRPVVAAVIFAACGIPPGFSDDSAQGHG